MPHSFTVAFTALLLVNAPPSAAQDLKLIRSLSGPSGKVSANTFIFDEARSRFVYPKDNAVTVLFEWEAEPGLHVLSGIWKFPDGRVASISPDVKIDAPTRSLTCYWIFHLVPGMTNGVWTLEVRVDGRPAGSHPFEVAGMTEPVAEIPLPSAPKQPSTTINEIYKTVHPSMVWIRKLDASGGKFDTSSGFVFGRNRIATSFQSVDSADKLEVEFADGRKVVQSALIAWSRAGDWAVLEAPTGDLVPVPPGDPAAVGVGERLIVFNFEANTRVVGGVDIAGRQNDKTLGERIQFWPPLAPQAAGGPLLNASGNVVGIVGGALNQGGHYSERTLNLSPGLWNGIQPDNAATPISALPAALPDTGQTLVNLARDGTLTPHLTPLAEFSHGGTVTNLPKDPNHAVPRETSEFSLRDPQIWIYSVWIRTGRVSKGEIGAGIYDSSNHLRSAAKSKKVALSSEPERVAFSVSPLSLGPGVYRIDVTWNGNAAWRTFIKISE